MGSMSELMIERWQSEPVDVEVGFLCPHCGHPAAAWLKVPCDDDESIEEVSCLNPETDHGWIVRLCRKNGHRTGSVEGHPGVEVSIKELDTSDDDDWDEPLPEPGAYGHFLDAMREWRSNVSAIGEPDGSSSRNRMVYGTLYSIAEAYFSDAIIGSALADTTVQRQLIKLEALGLHEKQLSLDTVLDKPTIVRDMLRATLQGISFHKLILVSRISEIAFGKPILPKDKDDRALAVASVQKRHDCVHRNGVDIEGCKHTDITQDYLRKMGLIFDEMALSLESAMRDAQTR
ncbi:hypothetical protein LAV84_28740 [Rhizobium sp. VS19-DR104.2]|uniref:hypothetical protein n=1 Tax=unclassified Rhizobium TaxID=2613769 RepID=UPI001CC678CD|nr:MULTISPECIES: hypothetical protein [unclassified Rhizobium]MBZ5763053.1 hypothetical protein [Rhizobium sp. VS19-DR96]MBZ5768831.1 hypothetical protein [Rhizobium sp. VS19-DR129.2]MBZ5776361.1 hypothetical protein [Rhizobium sp. VS19-DRK62.2]MBZ5787568.1 hypothetical protein [Rhizobium sp. VS19-DR121]MBZ5804923.1 hypothetical protein [Rhizobium sp. VS19-DR181]